MFTQFSLSKFILVGEFNVEFVPTITFTHIYLIVVSHYFKLLIPLRAKWYDLMQELGINA